MRWSKWLPLAEFWYNTTFHASIKTIPFQAVFGRKPPHLVSYGEKKTSNNVMEQQLMARDLALNALKEHLSVA